MNDNYSYNPHFFPRKEELPNATIVLVLGIVSLACMFLCCFAFIGVIVAIIAIIMGAQGRSLYKMYPDRYTEASYKNLNAGFICAIVSIGLNILTVILALVFNVAKSAQFKDLFN